MGASVSHDLGFMTYMRGSVQYLDSAMWVKQYKSPRRQRRNMVSHCCPGPHEATENRAQGVLGASMTHSSGSHSLLRNCYLPTCSPFRLGRFSEWLLLATKEVLVTAPSVTIVHTVNSAHNYYISFIWLRVSICRARLGLGLRPHPHLSLLNAGVRGMLLHHQLWNYF